MNDQGTHGHGWRLRRHTASLAGLAVILTAAACSATAAHTTSSTTNSASSAKLTVSSTLDGVTALPHRIHWQAFPRPSADVTEVDYLIDGKELWVEHVTPYFYGDDGNYLVTSFLTAGKHVFTVRAIDASGHSATDAVTATVTAAPPPPVALAGTWKVFDKPLAAGSCSPGPCPPVGYWRLVISPIGWQVYDTGGGGGLYDVSYLSAGLVSIETGMATGHPNTDGNAWCNEGGGDRPAGRPPVYIRWAVHGNQLSFSPVGNQKGSCGFTAFLEYHNTGTITKAYWARSSS
jgi:hypothetical protein